MRTWRFGQLYARDCLPGFLVFFCFVVVVLVKNAGNNLLSFRWLGSVIYNYLFNDHILIPDVNVNILLISMSKAYRTSKTIHGIDSIKIYSFWQNKKSYNAKVSICNRITSRKYRKYRKYQIYRHSINVRPTVSGIISYRIGRSVAPEHS